MNLFLNGVAAGFAVRIFNTSAGDDDDESACVAAETDDQGVGAGDVSTD